MEIWPSFLHRRPYLTSVHRLLHAVLNSVIWPSLCYTHARLFADIQEELGDSLSAKSKVSLMTLATMERIQASIATLNAQQHLMCVGMALIHLGSLHDESIRDVPRMGTGPSLCYVL
jgi:hypothetical protein